MNHKLLILTLDHFWWSLCRYQNYMFFLSCQPIQSNLFFLNTTVLPLANFFFTPAGRCFLFKWTVTVKFVPSNNNDSAKGTAVYQLPVKRWYLDQVKEPLALHKCHVKFHIHCYVYPLSLSHKQNNLKPKQWWCLLGMYCIARPLPS